MWQEKVDMVAGDLFQRCKLATRFRTSAAARQYTRRDVQGRHAHSATRPLTLVGAPRYPRRVVGCVRLCETIQVTVGMADTLAWCLRNETTRPRLVDEGPDLPPRSLDSPQPRQRTFARADKGIKIPQAGPLPPADQKRAEAGIHVRTCVQCPRE